MFKENIHILKVHNGVEKMKKTTKINPKKQYLPEKTCPVCNRSFAWRKKWERNWDEVKFCSQKCRLQSKVSP